MSLPVSLQTTVNEMDVFEGVIAYLNIRTGEFVIVPDDELLFAEHDEPLDGLPDWQQELRRTARDILFSDDYQALPSKYEIHEYAIMKDFCFSMTDDRLRERLLNSIRGRGAFRNFKDMIWEYGIVDDWYLYRKQVFRRIAKDWLEANNIPYTE